MIASLDVIGNPSQSWDNWKFLKSQNIETLPCFHIREKFEWLTRYKNETSYIAIGGLVPYTRQARIMNLFLSKYFGTLRDYKIHLYGIGNYNILKKYPCYSSDTTTWQQARRFGSYTEAGKSRRASFSEILKTKSNLPKDWKYFKDSADYRIKHGIKNLLKTEKEITEIWKMRKIVWT